jgi:hypothetical protein
MLNIMRPARAVRRKRRILGTGILSPSRAAARANPRSRMVRGDFPAAHEKAAREMIVQAARGQEGVFLITGPPLPP